MDDARKKVIRRTYGRGYHDGLRAARQELDDMNESKMQREVQALNGMAKKVLDAVPLADVWTQTQIIGELKRIGSNPDVEVVQACLSNLRGRGLVREPEAGKYQRVQPRRRQSPEPIVLDVSLEPSHHTIALQPVTTPATPDTPPQPDPLDVLAAMSARLKALADEARTIAAAMEEAALDVTTKIERARKDGDKLRQLQALLKGIDTE